MSHPYIGIVNPMTSARQTVAALNRRGFACVSIFSEKNSIEDMRELMACGRYDPSLFSHQFFLGPRDPEVIERLKALNLVSLINGFESAADTTDFLNHELKLPFANPLKTSAARFNKFATNERLRLKNVPTVQEIRITADAVHDNLNYLHGMTFPAVIKPTQSAGSFGVYFVKSKIEAHQILIDLIAQNDSLFEKTHSEYVIQEQLVGQEYVVDLVNFAGQCYFSGVYVYTKNIVNGRPLYQASSWVDPEDAVAKTLKAYVSDIMNAIEFHYGPAHVEVFLTAQGPRLVEVNPRVSGAQGYANKMVKHACQYDQFDLLADLYAQTPNLGDILNHRRHHHYSKMVILCNQHENATLNKTASEVIQSLASFKEMTDIKESQLPITIDLHTAVGFILLAHPDKKQLDQDYEHVLRLQNNALFLPA